MAQPRKARVGLAFILGIIGFSLIGLWALKLRDQKPVVDQYELQRGQARIEARQAIEKEAAELLYGEPAWVDKSKGIVRIPIDRAMELTAANLKAKPAQPTSIKAEVIPTLIVPPSVLEAREKAAAEEAASQPQDSTASEAPANGAPAAAEAPSSEAPATPAPEATPAAKSEN